MNNKSNKSNVTAQQQGLIASLCSLLVILNTKSDQAANQTAHSNLTEANKMPSSQSYWFSTQDAQTKRNIDVARSFAPQGATTIAAKALIFAAIVGTYIYYFTETDHPQVSLAFLTLWGYTTVVLYVTSSLLNSLWGTEGLKDASSLRVRTSWVLFELGLHLTTLASFGYYAFLFDPATDWEYLNIALHGGAFPLLLIDGLLINRIPFRMMHYIGFIIPVELMYIVWTLIHSRTEIGNPGNPNSDALYPGSLEWTEDLWVKTLILTALLMFVVGPIAAVGWWALVNGKCCCRDVCRYEEDSSDTTSDSVAKVGTSSDTTENKVSQGDVFADPESQDDGTEDLA